MNIPIARGGDPKRLLDLTATVLEVLVGAVLGVRCRTEELSCNSNLLRPIAPFNQLINRDLSVYDVLLGIEKLNLLLNESGDRALG